MYSDHIWLCLEDLGIAFAASPQQFENDLLEYEKVYRKFSLARRTEIDGQVGSVINGLSLLRSRIEKPYLPSLN
jgi:hypothetical protein